MCDGLRKISTMLSRYFQQPSSAVTFQVKTVWPLVLPFFLTLQLGGRNTTEGWCKLRGPGASLIFNPLGAELPERRDGWILGEAPGSAVIAPSEAQLQAYLGQPAWCLRQACTCM